MQVAAPGCSPAGTPGQSSQSSAGQSGPERLAVLGSDGRCGSSGHPSAAAVSLAVGKSSCYFTIGDFATFKFPTIDCFQQSQQLNLPAHFDTCHCCSFYITAVNVQQKPSDIQSHGPRHHLKISVGINLSK